MFAAISQPKLPDLIADRILEAIRTTPLHSGDKLPTETALAKGLNVGRTSIREALQKLQTLGIVEVIKGRGTFVKQLNVDDDARRTFARWRAEHAFFIEDLIEVRITLESMAAGLAAARASDDVIDELEAINRKHELAAEKGNVDDLLRTDEEFHELLFKSARNPLLVKLYQLLIAEFTGFRRKALAVPGVPENSVVGHASIVEMVKEHDAKRARASMIDHLWMLWEEIESVASTSGLSRDGSNGKRPARDTVV